MRKSDFPIFEEHPEWIYFDSAATAHKPASVIEALARFYKSEYATVHRAVYRPSIAATEKYHAARVAAARFLNAASPDEIVFTRGTTDAINLAALSYARSILKPGDEIWISQMEHHSNIVPWQMAAEQTGAVLKWIPMDANGVLQWEGLFSPRTKIVALAHMSNVTGTINPIAEIAAAAHAKGAVLLVDGAQAAASIPVDVQALGCDFYAFSGHKCYGPTGIGILYGKRELLAQMPPVQGGGDMIERVELEKTTYQKPPLRFEAGTPLIGPAIGLKEALDFIERIGRPQIAAHGQKLLALATEKLKKIPGLRVLGAAPRRGPILTFHVEGIHPLDLAMWLDLKHIAVRSGHLCAQPLLRAFGLEQAVRASFGVYNTEQEVLRFGDALEAAVRHLR